MLITRRLGLTYLSVKTTRLHPPPYLFHTAMTTNTNNKNTSLILSPTPEEVYKYTKIPDFSKMDNIIAMNPPEGTFRKKINVTQAIELLMTKNYELYKYNDCYGGRDTFTKETKELIQQIMDQNPQYTKSCATLLAVDQISPNKTNGEYAKYGGVIVHNQYFKFMCIDEYDGLETPYFDANKYFLHGIREIAAHKGLITNEEIGQIEESSKHGGKFVTVKFKE